MLRQRSVLFPRYNFTTSTMPANDKYELLPASDENENLLRSDQSDDDEEEIPEVPVELPVDPRFHQPTPAPWKRAALLLFLFFLFWLAFSMRKDLWNKKPEVIYAKRYASVYIHEHCQLASLSVTDIPKSINSDLLPVLSLQRPSRTVV